MITMSEPESKGKMKFKNESGDADSSKGDLTGNTSGVTDSVASNSGATGSGNISGK